MEAQIGIADCVVPRETVKLLGGAFFEKRGVTAEDQIRWDFCCLIDFEELSGFDFGGEFAVPQSKSASRSDSSRYPSGTIKLKTKKIYIFHNISKQ